MLKKPGRIGAVSCVAVLSVLVICALFFPNTYRTMSPYRFHYVLTDSMEPAIGTYSLVLAKTCDDDMQIEKKDDIIIFFATRFGEEITVMHRFSHTEADEEGELLYKTHPEGSDIPDIYETKREDILGVYLWHTPYIGKIILFLKSIFGLIWICQIAVILFVHALLSAKWKEC